MVLVALPPLSFPLFSSLPLPSSLPIHPTSGSVEWHIIRGWCWGSVIGGDMMRVSGYSFPFSLFLSTVTYIT